MKENNSPEVLSKPAAVLVVGGGIGGMRAALDLADAGLKVYLVEEKPCIGGRVAQLGFMFPQHDCVLCRGTPDHGFGCTRPSISPAYIQHNMHPNIELLTETQVIDIEGQAGDFTVALRQEPRYVDMTKCINCGYCAEVCPVNLPDDYQQGLTSRKAAYKVSARSAPDVYLIEKNDACDDCHKCEQVCPSHAINLNEAPRLRSVAVGAVILALGFRTFDPREYEELGYGKYPNVLHAMEYERLASRSGPTEGIIIKPSDHKKPTSIAWLQCIGSRDQNIAYCSSICCMYATKEAILAKQRLGEDVDCTVFIMDERAFNKEYRTYFANAKKSYAINYVYSRVSSIFEDPQTHELIVNYSHPNGMQETRKFDMVVLAVGLQPPESAKHFTELLDLELNQYGFCQTEKFTPLSTSHSGVFVCGAFSTPKEIAETVMDASGAAAEVMRLLNDRLHTYPYNREYPFLTTNNLPPEKDVNNEPIRTGVFVCTCGGTGIPIEQAREITKVASAFPNVVLARDVEYACFPDGQTLLKQTILKNEINRVVIGACSNRTHDPLFQRGIREAGLNPYLLELVNLREQCFRVHRFQPELATRKANEMLRMAVGRVSFSTPVRKRQHNCRPSALIIGGGLAGMTAALAIGDSGYQVYLIEQSDVLGGNLQDMYYVAEGYNPRRLGRDLINRVRSHKQIQALTRSRVISHSGHIGFFRSTIETRRTNGDVDVHQIEHGVTIIATGAKEAKNHPWLDIEGVITQRDLEEQIIHAPEKIAALKHVVMIQCVRPEGIPDYCSRVCCTNTMKNAIRLKLFNPECQVTVLYKNIVTYGFREQFYTDARRLGVVFVRYSDEQLPEITRKENQLVVRVYDTVLQRWLKLPADLIPLSMSIVPHESTNEIAKLFRVPLSSEGFFEEAQMKLRPMDFMREGIFLAGMAHYPKFIEETITQALAAAGRALTVLSQRDQLFLGGVVAVVDPDKCVGCLTCTRVCPFGIPQVVEEAGRHGVGGLGGAAFIDDALCQGCGTCTGECPANAIQLINYTDRQMMLREIRGLGQWLPQAQITME